MRKIIYRSEQANVDSGIMFGRGVFTTMYYKDKPLFIKEHISRLKNNMEAIGIPPLKEEVELISFIKKLPIKNMILKIVITEKNIIIAPRQNTYKEEIYLNGVSLNISQVIKNETSKLTNIKSLNYLENILIKENAIKEGFFDSILINTQGYVAETSSSNIFIVKNKKVYTPSIECGLLNGIVRSFVIHNFEVIEKKITLQELLDSDEVFITNSVFGIIKVNKIENRLYNSGKCFLKVKECYDDYTSDFRGGKHGG